MYMKFLALLFISIFSSTSLINGQVAINITGAAPDPSAIFDITCTTQGILLPRMTTSERDMIADPAVGLMIYNSSTNTFNYWNGSTWISMMAGGILGLSDADGDTKVEVEKNPDEDLIRFTSAGYEAMLLDGKTLHLKSPGQSTFIGDAAGINDDNLCRPIMD